MTNIGTEFAMNYYTADSAESISTLISTQAGLTIFNYISAEDVLMRKSRVTGLVLLYNRKTQQACRLLASRSLLTAILLIP